MRIKKKREEGWKNKRKIMGIFLVNYFVGVNL